MCLMLFSSSIFAQESRPPKEKYQQYMTEVFGAENVSEILGNARLADMYIDFFENRITYIKQTQIADVSKGYMKLSEIEIENTFNSNIQRDRQFNPVTFNPFKYKLSFFPKSTQYIRVDNTDYMIVVHSQNSIK